MSSLFFFFMVLHVIMKLGSKNLKMNIHFSNLFFYSASKQLVEYFLMTVEYYMALLVRGMPLFL